MNHSYRFLTFYQITMNRSYRFLTFYRGISPFGAAIPGRRPPVGRRPAAVCVCAGLMFNFKTENLRLKSKKPVRAVHSILVEVRNR